MAFATEEAGRCSSEVHPYISLYDAGLSSHICNERDCKNTDLDIFKDLSLYSSCEVLPYFWSYALHTWPNDVLIIQVKKKKKIL